jgi:hypothetical protein
MATKKKTKKKSTKSKKTAAPKKKQTKKRAVKRAAPQKSAKKTAAPNKAAAKKIEVKKSAPRKISGAGARETPKASRGRRASAVSPEMLGPGSGGQSGDLQGLSNVEDADSESVDELVEEGNAFEAGIVTGVEDAGRQGTKEVTTREVPEDDVPDEYLDQD